MNKNVFLVMSNLSFKIMSLNAAEARKTGRLKIYPTDSTALQRAKAIQNRNIEEWERKVRQDQELAQMMQEEEELFRLEKERQKRKSLDVVLPQSLLQANPPPTSEERMLPQPGMPASRVSPLSFSYDAEGKVSQFLVEDIKMDSLMGEKEEMRSALLASFYDFKQSVDEEVEKKLKDLIFEDVINDGHAKGWLMYKPTLKKKISQLQQLDDSIRDLVQEGVLDENAPAMFFNEYSVLIDKLEAEIKKELSAPEETKIKTLEVLQKKPEEMLLAVVQEPLALPSPSFELAKQTPLLDLLVESHLSEQERELQREQPMIKQEEIEQRYKRFLGDDVYKKLQQEREKMQRSPQEVRKKYYDEMPLELKKVGKDPSMSQVVLMTKQVIMYYINVLKPANVATAFINAGEGFTAQSLSDFIKDRLVELYTEIPSKETDINLVKKLVEIVFPYLQELPELPEAFLR